MTKTNAMRLLDIAKISYSVNEYKLTTNNNYGLQAAAQLNMEADAIFKTLVTKGDKTGINVFCIPVNSHLDLKKAAFVSNNKKLDLILNKDVLNTTGYMVGSCSPIGMKKQFPTYIEETAILFDEIGVSAGAKGLELVLAPQDLLKFINASFVSVIQD